MCGCVWSSPTSYVVLHSVGGTLLQLCTAPQVLLSLSLLFSLSLSGRLKTQQTDTNPWVGKINNLYFLKKKKSKKFFLFAFLLSLLLLLLLPCVRHAASFRHGPGREEERHAFHPFSTICLVLCLVAPVGRQMYAHGKCAHEKRQNV